MNKHVLRKITSLILCVAFLVAVAATPVAAAQASAATTYAAVSGQQGVFYGLAKNSWDPHVRASLNRLMRDYGSSSPNYNPNRKPYVVFDFDNTTSFFDVEEALLIYQLENLRFKIAPDQMYNVLVTEVPKTMFSADYSNSAGKRLNIDIVARDCQKAYQWLCYNYAGLGYGGGMSLKQIRETPQYKDFTTKVRYLYDAIGDTFDAAVSYPWVTYLFTGMTPAEVRSLATDSHDYWLAYKTWGKVKWESPSNYQSEAGVVSASYKTSIALPPESKDLYTKLMANGFDVYVCSASFIDVIEALAYNPKYGLNVPQGNVYAMMLKKDANGRYINAYDYDNYFQTQGPGKTATINKFIVPKYNGRGPIMVAGDSQGDYNMITEYKDMKLGLIINRVRSDDFKIISRIAAEWDGKEGARYVMQGRNENTGNYIPSMESILQGSISPQLVK